MDKKRLPIYLVLGLFVVAIFGLIMAHEQNSSDFPQHIGWAKEYATTGYLYKIPHTLFAKLVVIIRALLPANILVRISPLVKQVFDLKSYEISAWLLMVMSYLATAFILLNRLIKEWKNWQRKSQLWLAGFAVLVLLLVGPIFIFTFPERLYLGYFSPNPFHNPTYILFRPFVLIVFFGVTDNFIAKWNWKEAIVIAFAIMCATLAKPSFTLTFLPAIGLVFLFFHIKKIKQINWLYFIIPLGLTSLILLASQFYINYSGDRGDTLILAPFQALLNYVPNIFLILVFCLLSILFPLLVSLIFYKDNVKSVSFQLVWMNFFVALGMGYLIGEKINLRSNNFAWGVMIAVFLLFVEAMIIFGKEINKNGFKAIFKSWKMSLTSAVLFLHLVCGVVYFVFCLTRVTPLVV